MSTFSDQYAACMHSKGLPAFTLEGLAELKEMLEQLHSAWESAGGEVDQTLGELIALGILAADSGIDVAILGQAAGIAVLAYETASVACMLSAAGSAALRALFASNPPQPFMSQELASLGVPLGDSAVA